MPNFDGVYELRFKYDVTIGTQLVSHVLTQDVNLVEPVLPGTPFNEIETQGHNGTTSTLDTEVEGFIDAIAPQMSNATDFTTVELWKYPPEGFDAVFYGVYASGVSGTNVNPAQAAHYDIFTFRTLGGGIMRLTLLESTNSANNVQSFPTASTVANALFNYITNLSRPWVGRDNFRPLAALKWSQGQNEAIWRRRFRA